MSESSSRRFCCTLVILALMLVPRAIAGADNDLSKREARRLQRAGETALAERDLATAITTFQRLAAALPEGDPRRAEVLYSLALASLLRADEAAAAGDGHRQRAMTRLEELAATFPAFERRAEAEVLGAALEREAAARRAARRELAELQEAADAEVEECRRALAESTADESSQADEVRKLEAELRKLRSRLSATQKELEKKDEALRKVKETLVGG